MFRLASHLGRTVSELERELGGRELVEWIVYLDESPPDRADQVRTAQLCATVANFSGNSKRTLKIGDFLPDPPQSRDQAGVQKSFLRSFDKGAN